jgi:dihydroorotase
MSVSPTFDLLLRGGRVIDPAAGIDGIKDVAIRNNK